MTSSSCPMKNSAVALVLAAFGVHVIFEAYKVYKKQQQQRDKKASSSSSRSSTADGAPKKLQNNLDESMPAPRRFGGTIKLRPEKYRKYRELHDDIWPAVLRRMEESNMRNFTVYYHEETSVLFFHFEWIGHWKLYNQGKAFSTRQAEEEELLLRDDMNAVAADETTRRWWTECEPCQEPFSQWASSSDDDANNNKPPPSRGGSGDWWAPMECVGTAGHWPTAYSTKQYDPDFVKLDDDQQ